LDQVVVDCFNWFFQVVSQEVASILEELITKALQLLSDSWVGSNSWRQSIKPRDEVRLETD
jgi:hypothetical protein